NRAGGAKAAEYLLAAGHRRIAHIAGWDGASTQRDREAGFCGALAARGVTLQGREVGNFDPGQAAAATRRLFSSGPAFAFAGSSADCNGDGIDDISCSGSSCSSVDEGPGQAGRCYCMVTGGMPDSKTCAEDAPKIIGLAFGGGVPDFELAIDPTPAEVAPVAPEAPEAAAPAPRIPDSVESP
ncbi:MAG: substrate-binding domain-containing protein, partial [Acidobacteriota bacterium]